MRILKNLSNKLRVIYKPNLYFILFCINITLYIIFAKFFLPLEYSIIYLDDTRIDAANAEITNLTDQFIAKQNVLFEHNLKIFFSGRQKEIILAGLRTQDISQLEGAQREIQAAEQQIAISNQVLSRTGQEIQDLEGRIEALEAIIEEISKPR